MHLDNSSSSFTQSSLTYCPMSGFRNTTASGKDDMQASSVGMSTRANVALHFSRDSPSLPSHANSSLNWIACKHMGLKTCGGGGGYGKGKTQDTLFEFHGGRWDMNVTFLPVPFGTPPPHRSISAKVDLLGYLVHFVVEKSVTGIRYQPWRDILLSSEVLPVPSFPQSVQQVHSTAPAPCPLSSLPQKNLTIGAISTEA